MEIELCALCGRRAECKHHLIYGTAYRKLADEDGLIIPICNKCHTLARQTFDRIHGNPAAEKLSKMLGQAIWERDWILNNGGTINGLDEFARAAFRARYGRNFL